MAQLRWGTLGNAGAIDPVEVAPPAQPEPPRVHISLALHTVPLPLVTASLMPPQQPCTPAHLAIGHAPQHAITYSVTCLRKVDARNTTARLLKGLSGLASCLAVHETFLGLFHSKQLVLICPYGRTGFNHQVAPTVCCTRQGCTKQNINTVLQKLTLCVNTSSVQAGKCWAS